MYFTVARFPTANQLTIAVQALKVNEWGEWEVFSPHPLEGIKYQTKNIGVISRTAFICGLFGLLAALAMQVVPTAVLYPLSVGGKSILSSLPAFLPIAIESTILFAAGGVFAAFLVRVRLPCQHNPLFNLEEFRKASRDAYFVAVYCKNREDSEKAARFLIERGGEHVIVLPKENISLSKEK